jgi:Lipase maturation factor
MAYFRDKLLLETGILCILMAPLTPGGAKKAAPKDSIILWMVKWLLFRLMFSTCILKFTTKGSKLWWQLAGTKILLN